MPNPRRTTYPEAAISWLVPGSGRAVLDVGSGRGAVARMLVDAGHRVCCVDHDRERLARLAQRLPQAYQVVAKAESLPFTSRHFDAVTLHESSTGFAPGLALAEFARVLRPGGTLCLVLTSRDDSVPWVKRLARLLQAEDPTAMQGDFETPTLRALADSPYFPEVEQRTFRNWLPITREGLIQMVSSRPALAKLPAERLESLQQQVGALYDSSARAPEPLLLPFQARCWRAVADHSELTLPVGEDGLRITMRM